MPLKTARLVLLLLACGVASGVAGCSPTRIPPPPASFDTVVLTSELSANRLYAEGLAAFLRNNWESVGDGTGGPSTDTGGLTMLIRPDGASVRPGAPDLLVRVVVQPLDSAQAAAPSALADPALADPDYAGPDYAGPDLARRELEDRARRQDDADSLRIRARIHPTNTGSAVLTASVREANPATRDVLIRAARILASVSGTISYR